jgi:metal-dependent hydrolase (beta-lactamase superfamily II)
MSERCDHRRNHIGKVRIELCPKSFILQVYEVLARYNARAARAVLAFSTPEGMVIVVGCSHPDIDRIVESASAINPRIRFIAGGFHLVVASDPDIEKIVSALHDRFKVEYIAPGHCTGEPAFTALKRAFGDHYLYAGLGTTLTLNPAPH